MQLKKVFLFCFQNTSGQILNFFFVNDNDHGGFMSTLHLQLEAVAAAVSFVPLLVVVAIGLVQQQLALLLLWQTVLVALKINYYISTSKMST